MDRGGFIKSVYWGAAAVDGFVAVGMLYPRLLRASLGIAADSAHPDVRYALNTAAALMFGWTALLIWASVEPVARRGVLFLTAVPVIAGLALATLLGVRSSYIPLGGALRVWLLQSVLVAGIAAAYRAASDLAEK
ncbi:MAG TPA: hypothetical protein VF532_04780 [Candidatus Angelobacter sp.]